jgi:hypothetical protein
VKYECTTRNVAGARFARAGKAPRFADFRATCLKLKITDSKRIVGRCDMKCDMSREESMRADEVVLG